MQNGKKDQAFSTPLKAVRAKCLDCSGNSVTEVKLCPIKNCPLYPYRHGKNPKIKKRELSEEQKAAFKERLAEARKKRRKSDELSNSKEEIHD